MPTNVYIVLLGNPGAGKSCYLFSLGLALQQCHNLTLRRRWTVLNLSESYEQQIKVWKRQHSDKEKIDATSPNSSLQFHFELKDKYSEEVYRIRLADMAGAEGLSCRNVAKIFPQLAEEKSIKGGVLFLVDSQNLLRSEPEQYEQCAKWLKELFKPDIFQSFGICLTKTDENFAVYSLNEKYPNKYSLAFDIGNFVEELQDYLKRSIDIEIKNACEIPSFNEILNFISQQEVDAKYHYVSALGLCKDKQHPVPKQPFNVFGPILDVVENVNHLSEQENKDLLGKLQEIISNKEQELESLKQELSDKAKIFESQEAELQNEKHELTQKIIRLQEDIQQQKNLNNSKQIQLNSLKNELSKVLVDHKKLAEEIEKLKQIVQKKEEKINQLKQQLADEKQSVIALGEQLKDKQSELEQSDASVRKLHVDSLLYPQQIKQQSQKIEELEEKLGKRDERGILERIFIGLSGCDSKTLATCSKQEQVAQIRLGMSVLIPTLFGFVAALLYLSGLNIPLLFGILLAFVWATMVLSIDVSVLATSRIHLGNKKSYYSKFLSRIVLAILVGFVVSHPLSLRLFGGTIETQMDKMRGTEIKELNTESEAEINKSFGGIKEAFDQISGKEPLSFNTGEDINGALSRIKTTIRDDVSQCEQKDFARARIKEDNTIKDFQQSIGKLNNQLTFCKKNINILDQAKKSELEGTGKTFLLDGECEFSVEYPQHKDTSNKKFSKKFQVSIGKCSFEEKEIITSAVPDKQGKCLGPCCKEIEKVEGQLSKHIGDINNEIVTINKSKSDREGELKNAGKKEDDISRCKSYYGNVTTQINNFEPKLRNIRQQENTINNKNDELFKTKALFTFIFDSLFSEEKRGFWEGIILVMLYSAVALVILTLDTMPIIMKVMYYGEYDKKVQFDAESHVGVYTEEYKKERTNLLKDTQNEKEKSKVEAEKFRIRQERIKLFQDEMDRMDAELLKKEHNKRLIIAGIKDVFSKKLKEGELNKELESLRDMKSKMQDDFVKNF